MIEQVPDGRYARLKVRGEELAVIMAEKHGHAGAFLTPDQLAGLDIPETRRLIPLSNGQLGRVRIKIELHNIIEAFGKAFLEENVLDFLSAGDIPDSDHPVAAAGCQPLFVRTEREINYFFITG